MYTYIIQIYVYIHIHVLYMRTRMYVYAYLHMALCKYINIYHYMKISYQVSFHVHIRAYMRTYVYIYNTMGEKKRKKNGTRYSAVVRARRGVMMRSMVGSLARFKKRHTFSMEPFSSKSCFFFLCVCVVCFSLRARFA